MDSGQQSGQGQIGFKMAITMIPNTVIKVAAQTTKTCKTLMHYGYATYACYGRHGTWLLNMLSSEGKDMTGIYTFTGPQRSSWKRHKR